MRICAVLNCGATTSDLNRWRKRHCLVHKCKYGTARCTCDPPFEFFPFPTEEKDPKTRQQWINSVNRKDKVTGKICQPMADSCICSLHFVDRKPTVKHPVPTLNLGYPTDEETKELPTQKANTPQTDQHPGTLDLTAVTEQEVVQIKEEQLLQFTAVCVKSEESSPPDVKIHWSPESSLKQETSETPQIKEEPEEQSVKQEEEQLPPFTETSPKTDNIIITNVVSLSDVRMEHNYSAEPSSRPETDTQTTNKSVVETSASVRDGHTTGTWMGHRKNHDFTICKKNLKKRTRNYTGRINCLICKKTFLRDYFTVHMKQHTGEKPYSCSTCKKRFILKRYLTSHMATHTGERPYKCPDCDKAFTEKHYLRIHRKRHSGVRPHSCSICNKTFLWRWCLMAHMAIHTGEKPFKCPDCDKTFALKCRLKAHLKKHTVQLPCSLCNKTFTEKSHIKTHMRIHTGERPYRCSVCDKTFTQMGSRDAYMRCHTGERPYRCTVCDKTFSQKGICDAYMRCHTGERPYRCTVCKKTFPRKYYLIKHMKRHTNER